jgi:hypothetical protein
MRKPETAPTLSASQLRSLASSKADFTTAIKRGKRPRRRDIYVRKNGKTVYQRGMTDAKAFALIDADKRARARAHAQSDKKKTTGNQAYASQKAVRAEKAYKRQGPLLNLRIWKHSHGGHSFENEKERERYKQRRVITLSKKTGKGQALAFKEEMLPRDFVYLCHQNRVQLLGQLTSDLQKASAKWPERKYRIIKDCAPDSKFAGPQKKWTPNFNSTCALVPSDELPHFEQRILVPFFGLRLRDLQAQALEEPITPDEDDALASLPRREYAENRRKLVLHKRRESVLVRNRKLVADAKKHFKTKHGKLFCEGCEFEFQMRYGVRGLDFIEAHHSTPIAHIKAGTKLKVTDLNMVCANCHRMLHRAPWITVRQLRKEIVGTPT